MEKYNLLYIDDDIDSQLSEYLDKDLRNAIQDDVVLNISEHEFKPVEGYKSLLTNQEVSTANIILIDSRLFENSSANDGKFSGEEFKIILRKQFPFIEVIVITQTEKINLSGRLQNLILVVGSRRKIITIVFFRRLLIVQSNRSKFIEI